MGRFFNPIIQAFDAIGVGSESARLFFYEQGTTIFQTTFQDEDLTIPNENPVTPDTSSYFPPIYLQDLDYTIRFEVLNTETDEFEQKWTTDLSGTDIAVATESSTGVVQLATSAEVAAGTGVNVIQARYVDQMVIDASQVTGTLSASNMPAATTTALGAVELATQAEMDAGASGVVPTADVVKAFVDAAVSGGTGGTFDNFAIRINSTKTDTSQVSEGTKWIEETTSGRPVGSFVTDVHNVGGGAENRSDRLRYQQISWTSDGATFNTAIDQ